MYNNIWKKYDVKNRLKKFHFPPISFNNVSTFFIHNASDLLDIFGLPNFRQPYKKKSNKYNKLYAGQENVTINNGPKRFGERRGFHGVN